MIDNETTDLAQRVALAKEAIKLQEEMRHQTSLFIQQHTTSLVAFDLLLESFSSLPTPYTSQQIDEMMGWLKNDWSSLPNIRCCRCRQRWQSIQLSATIISMVPLSLLKASR